MPWLGRVSYLRVSRTTPQGISNLHPTVATTTCPCRVQHVPGQSEPKINVPAKPFTVIIEYLRSLQFHGRMREHESSQRNDSPEDGGFERLTKAWSRLHDEEKAYLSIIENPTYHLHLQAQGVAGTRELVRTFWFDRGSQ